MCTLARSIVEIVRGELECDDLTECVLGLKGLDLQSYRILCKQGDMTVEILSERLDKEKSTVYRSLQNLLKAGLVSRRKGVINGGGYYYVYRALDPHVLKQNLMANINQWYQKMMLFVRDIDKEIMK
ncbi:MAG: helix-turn-helix domain-containing protein [Methermicoccaceae archaeon]